MMKQLHAALRAGRGSSCEADGDHGDHGSGHGPMLISIFDISLVLWGWNKMYLTWLIYFFQHFKEML